MQGFSLIHAGFLAAGFAVAVPVVIRDRVFCVVELFNRIGKPCFDEHDLELVVHVAEMAAKIIEVRLMLQGARKSEAA